MPHTMWINEMLLCEDPQQASRKHYDLIEEILFLVFSRLDLKTSQNDGYIFTLGYSTLPTFLEAMHHVGDGEEASDSLCI